MTSMPRPNPCPSCPYRRDVPSGVWDASEYDKLTTYDGEIHEQVINGATAAFGCHQADGSLCAGWVGHRERPSDLLAVRLGVLNGSMDPEVYDYRTRVPLFESGAQAALHGKREITDPGERARAAALKVATVRAMRGDPVRYDDGEGTGQ
jgi:Family of unknown function (DUF6283)